MGDVYEKVTVNLDKGTVYADGEKSYILKYATEEETQEAYDKLVEEYGEDKIFYDRVYKADEVMDGAVSLETKADAVYTSGSYLDTAKPLGLYNVNQQINKSGYKQNKVTVAVLDSGLVYYTNPSCEIGRKLRDKFNTKMCYVFSNAENTRDTMGHGTMFSSVIAYNTPDNVQYGVFKVMDANNVLDYVPVKGGYEFQGWYTSLDGGKQVLPTTKMTIPRDHSLYAHWKKK